MKAESPQTETVQLPEGLSDDPGETYHPDQTAIYVSGGAPAATGDRDPEGSVEVPAPDDRFQLLRFVDRGGYGEVWEATQLSLNRTVAIKRLREDVLAGSPDSAFRVQGFRREVLTTAALEHPNIIPVYDAGEDRNGNTQLAMRFVRGTNWQLMVERDRDLPQADFFARHLPILVDVAQAIAYAHSRGVIHRDIKPAQVLVGEFGEVFLVDWGLAMFVDGNEDLPPESGNEAPRGTNDESTQSAPADSGSTAYPAGTPAYMAPEQTDSVPDRLGTWTDVYLLGGTLHYLLTGSHPRRGVNAAEAFRMAGSGVISPAKTGDLKTPIPEDLARLAREAMSVTPQLRPTAREYIDGLQDHLSGATKRRDSRRLTGEVAGILATDVDSYGLLSRCGSNLDRAEGLWKDNPAIAELRERMLIDFAQAAMANGDLELAKRQAEQLTGAARRRELLADVQTRTERIRRNKRQRRFFARASAILGVLLVIAGVIYTVEQERARRRLAEQRNEAIVARQQAERLAGFMLGDLTASLEGMGRLDLLDKVAKETVSYYRQRPVDLTGRGPVMRRSLALRSVGRVLRSQGEVMEARVAIDESIVLIRALAERHPNDTAIRRQLADRLLDLGLLMEHTADPDAAARSFSEALALHEELLETDPVDVDLRRDLARSLSGLGYEQWARADFDEALTSLRRADAILTDLVEDLPGDVESTRLLLETRSRVGGVLRDTERLDEAAAVTRNAISIGDGLVEEHPENVLNLGALSECASSLGFTLWQMDDLEGALVAYTKAFTIDRELAGRDPSNQERQRQLASSQSNVGEMLRGLGDLTGALRSQTAAVEILAPLVEENPDHAEWRYALAAASLELGSIHTAAGNASEARRSWRLAVEQMEKVALERGDLYYLDTYARALLLLGLVEDARPVVDELRTRGWANASFVELCEAAGL